jgi:ABC-type Fe3+-hydroxamate transport system substrate-binding protein
MRRASGSESPTISKSRAPSSIASSRRSGDATRARGCGWLLLFAFAAACSPPSPAGVPDQIGSPARARSPRRVVALAPDVTELAYALGVGPLLVGVPSAADYPPAARVVPRIDPADVESVLARSPDLVLATTAGNDPGVVDRLRRLGVAVCTVDVTSFDTLAAAVSVVGRLTHHEVEARAVAARLGERVAGARRRAARLSARRALYVVWWEPLIVAAPGTFHDDLLRTAGLANLAPGSAGRYPRVDPELLLDPRLEVVVAPDDADARASYDAILARPVAARLRSGATRVLWLPADLANRPGPRLVDALEALVSAREAAP